jgi:hypothetical protein
MTLVRPTCQRQANQFFAAREIPNIERGSRFRWAQELVLALGTLISLAYQEKRQQEISRDAL